METEHLNHIEKGEHHMLKLFTRKMQKLQLYALPIIGKQNWHYEVISKDIFDDMGNYYFNIKEAVKAGLSENNLMISESILPEEHLLFYRYAENENDPVNITNALKCHLGVVAILKGRNKGTEFVYSLFEDQSEISVQLMAYGFLTYGKVDKRLLEMVKSEPYYLDILMLSVGDVAFLRIDEFCFFLKWVSQEREYLNAHHQNLHLQTFQWQAILFLRDRESSESYPAISSTS